jgi:hypothetical protein
MTEPIAMNFADNLVFLAACGMASVFAGLAVLPRPASRRTWQAGLRLAAAALLLMTSVWCMFRLALRVEFPHADPNLRWASTACVTSHSRALCCPLGPRA